MSTKATMTASQWAVWARRRRAEADEIKTTYLRQADRAEKMLAEANCPCNPIIALHVGPQGPTFASPLVTHALECAHHS